MSSSQALAERTPAQELARDIRGADFQSQVAMLLPEGMRPERFARVVASAILANPDLADERKADRATLFQAALRAAQDGLLPDGREGALVPYKGKVSWLPMIGGYRKIAGDHGWVIRTRVVFANDRFVHEEGLNERLEHTPTPPGQPRGDLIATYAIGNHRDGRKPEFRVMYADEIAKVRAKAQTKIVWEEWPERMWEKSVGKQLFKVLPLDDSDARVRTVVHDLEPGEAAGLLYGPSRAITSPAPQTPPAIEGEQAAAAAITPDGAAAASSTQDAAIDVDADFDTGDETSEELQAVADLAAMYVPPTGQFSQEGEKGPKTLSEILALDNGSVWLRAALARVSQPQEYVTAIWAFARVHAPELHAEALAKRAEQ